MATPEEKQARAKIVKFLIGTLWDALESKTDQSWLYKDEAGDRLQNDKEKMAARTQAHKVLERLADEFSLVKDG